MITFFNTIVYMSTVSIFTIFIILLARFTVCKKLSAKVKYLLWGIALFRLVIPITFTSEVSMLNIYPVLSATNQSHTETTLLVKPAEDFINRVIYSSDVRKINEGWIPIIWLIISSALLLIVIMAYFSMREKLKEAILINNDYIGKFPEDIFSNKKIQLYSINSLKTPIVFGVFKPKIIIPEYLIENEEPEILSHVIRHEMVHVQRKDYLVKIIGIVVVCIQWFNPIVWVAFILAQRDMECSCDEIVLQRASGDIRKEYARALIRFVTIKVKREAYHGIAFGKSCIRNRIKGILNYKRPSRKKKIFSYLFLFVAFLAVATNANNGAEIINLEQLKQERKETWTELSQISEYVIEAAIISQDRNFMMHNGADLYVVIRAGINNLCSHRYIQGGATITQQLVKNINTSDSTNGFLRKRSELNTTINMERAYSKDMIMEAFLNCVYFGNNQVGIKAAARYYFDKTPSDLTKEEAAKLMAIIDQPNKYDPITQQANNFQKAEAILIGMGKS